MRIALISDIHGNLVSLQTALADIEQRGVDEIICLGDVATLGAQPNEVIACLQALGCRCVMGNHDSFLIDRDDILHYTDDAAVVGMVDWCKTKLSSAELDFLRTFVPMFEVPLGGDDTMLCFHGSPRSNTELILATTPEDKLVEALAGCKATVMVGGHSHIQMLRRLGDALVVNAGSVGAPFRTMPPAGRLRILPWIEYAIVDWRAGILNVEMQRVPVDMKAMHGAILASDMPNAADWLVFWD